MNGNPPDTEHGADPVVDDMIAGAIKLHKAAYADLLKSLDETPPALAVHAAREWAIRWAPEWVELMTQARLAAFLKGMQDTADALDWDDGRPPAPVAPPESWSGGTNGYPLIDNAAAFLQENRIVGVGGLQGAAGQAIGAAQVDAYKEGQSAVDAVRDALITSTRTGGDLRAFQAAVSGLMDKRRAENVFRSNVMRAYSDGQSRLLDTPHVGSLFPYAAYHATHDDRARKDHLAMEKLGIQGTNIYRRDDPVFQAYRPPWSWQCRCAWVPISLREAASRGIVEAKEWLDTGIAPVRPTFVEAPPFPDNPEFRSQQIELATKASLWRRYHGPEGGAGWRNLQTGEVRYQAKSPDVRPEAEQAEAGPLTALNEIADIGWRAFKDQHHDEATVQAAAIEYRQGAGENLGVLPGQLEKVGKGLWWGMRLGNKQAAVNQKLGKRALASTGAPDPGAAAVVSALDFTADTVRPLRLPNLGLNDFAAAEKVLPVGQVAALAATGNLQALKQARRASRTAAPAVTMAVSEQDAAAAAGRIKAALAEHDHDELYLSCLCVALEYAESVEGAISHAEEAYKQAKGTELSLAFNTIPDGPTLAQREAAYLFLAPLGWEMFNDGDGWLAQPVPAMVWELADGEAGKSPWVPHIGRRGPNRGKQVGWEHSVTHEVRYQRQRPGLGFGKMGPPGPETVGPEPKRTTKEGLARIDKFRQHLAKVVDQVSKKAPEEEVKKGVAALVSHVSKKMTRAEIRALKQHLGEKVGGRRKVDEAKKMVAAALKAGGIEIKGRPPEEGKAGPEPTPAPGEAPPKVEAAPPEEEGPTGPEDMPAEEEGPTGPEDMPEAEEGPAGPEDMPEEAAPPAPAAPPAVEKGLLPDIAKQGLAPHVVARAEEYLKSLGAPPPPPAEGMVRLYRGTAVGEVPHEEAFFTDDRGLAGVAIPFAKAPGRHLAYVDVPQEVAEKTLMRGGAVTEGEHQNVPEEYRQQLKPWGAPAPPAAAPAAEAPPAAPPEKAPEPTPAPEEPKISRAEQLKARMRAKAGTKAPAPAEAAPAAASYGEEETLPAAERAAMGALTAEQRTSVKELMDTEGLTLPEALKVDGHTEALAAYSRAEAAAEAGRAAAPAGMSPEDRKKAIARTAEEMGATAEAVPSAGRKGEQLPGELDIEGMRQAEAERTEGELLQRANETRLEADKAIQAGDTKGADQLYQQAREMRRQAEEMRRQAAEASGEALRQKASGKAIRGKTEGELLKEAKAGALRAAAGAGAKQHPALEQAEKALVGTKFTGTPEERGRQKAAAVASTMTLNDYLDSHAAGGTKAALKGRHDKAVLEGLARGWPVHPDEARKYDDEEITDERQRLGIKEEEAPAAPAEAAPVKKVKAKAALKEKPKVKLTAKEKRIIDDVDKAMSEAVKEHHRTKEETERASGIKPTTPREVRWEDLKKATSGDLESLVKKGALEVRTTGHGTMVRRTDVPEGYYEPSGPEAPIEAPAAPEPTPPVAPEPAPAGERDRLEALAVRYAGLRDQAAAELRRAFPSGRRPQGAAGKGYDDRLKQVQEYQDQMFAANRKLKDLGPEAPVEAPGAEELKKEVEAAPPLPAADTLEDVVQGGVGPAVTIASDDQLARHLQDNDLVRDKEASAKYDEAIKAARQARTVPEAQKIIDDFGAYAAERARATGPLAKAPPAAPEPAEAKAPWHGNREGVFAEMRKLHDKVTREWEQANAMAPRSGEVAVGGADFDHVLKATVGDEYLRTLRKGGTPKEAYDAAVAAGREAVEKWNTQGSKGRMSAGGSYQLKRDPGAGDAYALGIHSAFRDMGEGKPAPKEEAPPPEPAPGPLAKSAEETSAEVERVLKAMRAGHLRAENTRAAVLKNVAKALGIDPVGKHKYQLAPLVEAALKKTPEAPKAEAPPGAVKAKAKLALKEPAPGGEVKGEARVRGLLKRITEPGEGYLKVSSGEISNTIDDLTKSLSKEEIDKLLAAMKIAGKEPSKKKAMEKIKGILDRQLDMRMKAGEIPPLAAPKAEAAPDEMAGHPLAGQSKERMQVALAKLRPHENSDPFGLRKHPVSDEARNALRHMMKGRNPDQPSLTMADIQEGLKKRMTKEPTIRDVQAAVLAAHDAGELRLKPFTGPTGTIPRPELVAPFQGGNGYYVSAPLPKKEEAPAGADDLDKADFAKLKAIAAGEFPDEIDVAGKKPDELRRLIRAKRQRKK